MSGPGVPKTTLTLASNTPGVSTVTMADRTGGQNPQGGEDDREQRIHVRNDQRDIETRQQALQTHLQEIQRQEQEAEGRLQDLQQRRTEADTQELTLDDQETDLIAREADINQREEDFNDREGHLNRDIAQQTEEQRLLLDQLHHLQENL